MNEHDATEVAFKNGYKQGTVDAVRKISEMLKEKITVLSYAHFLVDQIAKEILEENT